jgi:uncharacterized protein YndB with AHSA1/START domain
MRLGVNRERRDVMAKPNKKEHRFEFSVEVSATPEQVWDAIATGGGISSWFLRTEMEEREGGRIVTYMGEDDSSPGTVTGWEPPHRFVYEEPGWAALAGHEGAEVTPLVSEFIVEAQSGGSCVVRITSSAFGTGADWENEFFEGMGQGWVPYFDRLKLYLQNFPGQRAEVLDVHAKVAGTDTRVAQVIRERIGASEVGQALAFNGLEGTVTRIGKHDVLVSVSHPVTGYIGFSAFDGVVADPDEDTDSDSRESLAFASGQFFGEGAAEFVEQEGPKWKEWLGTLEVAGVYPTS